MKQAAAEYGIGPCQTARKLNDAVERGKLAKRPCLINGKRGSCYRVV